MRYLFILLNLLWVTCSFALEPGEPAAANQSVVEGTFLQVSKLPPPRNNPYPDCYYTASLEITKILSGRSIPQKVVLVLPGFFGREYAPEAKYKTGDKIRATVVPFASMPEKVRQTQQADEIEDITLDFFFPQKITLVEKFGEVADPVPFLGKPGRADGTSDWRPIDVKARAIRQETMRRDLEQIDKLLAEHGGDWDKWYDSLKDFREQYKKQHEAKAQRWIGNSFFSAGQIPHAKAYTAEFVQSIIGFKNYLASRNVDLILVRFPYKGEIADDLFAPVPPDQVSNPYLLRLYKELLEADVEIITDTVAKAKEARLKYPLMYWYQDFPESHPAEGMLWVVAESLAERLNRYENVRKAEKKGLRIRQVSAEAISRPASKFAVWPNNVFWPAGNPRFNSEDYARFSTITHANGEPVTLQEGLDSPVLVVGSSFVRYPSYELGATLTTYLAYLTGIVPDTLSRLGSDQSIPRIIAREDDSFLKNRSVCLFPLAPWAFYGALDSPLIVNPVKYDKALLASFAGKELERNIELAKGTPMHVFSYSKERHLVVQAVDEKSGRGFGGRFKLPLPQQIAKYPYFMIEIQSQPGDSAAVLAKYGSQKYRFQKFYKQKNSEDLMIFQSENALSVEFEIGNLEPSFQTVIQGIKIYGLKQ